MWRPLWARALRAAVSGGPNLPSQPGYASTEEQTLAAQETMAPELFADTSNPAYGQPAYNQLQTSTLASLAPQMSDIGAAANTAQRSANVSDLNTIGPAAGEGVLNADPLNAQLMPALNQSAMDGLAAGSGLTADQTRDIQQSSRAASAARGMSGSNASEDEEVLNQFSLGNTLLQQRQNFANSLAKTNNTNVGAPALAMLGTNSTAVPMALQSESQSGPTLFNPAAGNNLATSNYSTGVQAAIGTPSPLAEMSQSMTGLGNLANGVGNAYKGYNAGGGGAAAPAAASGMAGYYD